MAACQTCMGIFGIFAVSVAYDIGAVLCSGLIQVVHETHLQNILDCSSCQVIEVTSREFSVRRKDVEQMVRHSEPFRNTYLQMQSLHSEAQSRACPKCSRDQCAHLVRTNV